MPRRVKKKAPLYWNLLTYNNKCDGGGTWYVAERNSKLENHKHTWEKHEHKFSRIKTTTTRAGQSDNRAASCLHEKLCARCAKRRDEAPESVKTWFLCGKMFFARHTNTKFQLYHLPMRTFCISRRNRRRFLCVKLCDYFVCLLWVFLFKQFSFEFISSQHHHIESLRSESSFSSRLNSTSWKPLLVLFLAAFGSFHDWILPSAKSK